MTHDGADFEPLLREVAIGTPASLALAIEASGIAAGDEALIGIDSVANQDVATTATTIGLALRQRGADRALMNEFFRLAFYRSGRSSELARNDLYALFLANRAAAPLDKWVHYFDIYERHLGRFRDRSPRVLEIGVFRGGGLMLLQQYLGPDATLIGVDIDESARRACDGRFVVEVGDQSDRAFLERVAASHGPFDIVIDDGGHMASQQIASLETIFPHVRSGGVYLVEDCHTSYWQDYIDGAESFIAYATRRIDDLNAFHAEDGRDLSHWSHGLGGIHFHDSVVVFDRTDRWPPFCEISGTDTALLASRDRLMEDVHERTIIADLTDLMARAESVSMQLEVEVGRLEVEVGRLEVERAQAVATAAEHNNVLVAIYASRSWRATQLLRSIARLLRRGRDRR